LFQNKESRPKMDVHKYQRITDMNVIRNEVNIKWIKETALLFNLKTHYRLMWYPKHSH
jgi:hypothetical protein